MEMSKTFLDDMNDILRSPFAFDSLGGKRFLITGASGFVGSYLAKTLLFLNEQKRLGVKVYAVVRDMQKARLVYGTDAAENGNLCFLPGDVTRNFGEYIPDDVRLDYIVHTASVTSSRAMIECPVETAKTSLTGSLQMLDCAVRHKIESMVYISSMEVYGDVSNYSGTMDESKIGIIDPLAVRSCYPESKRMVENLCVDYSMEYHVPVKIARLAQTFGAGIHQSENRIFAQFARSVIHKTNIILHTKGLSYGNYCYIADTILGILYILLYGKNGEAYNIANMDSRTTISQMAHMVASEVAQNKIAVEYDIPKDNVYGYANDTALFLDSGKLQSLGWRATVSLKESYRKLISYMIENNIR